MENEFHHIEEQEPKSSKIMHWVVLAVILLGIGGYVVESGMLNSAPAKSAQNFPRGL